MPLSTNAAKDLIEEIKQIRETEMAGLNLLLDYRQGKQAFPVNLGQVPPEVQAYSRMSRINMVELAVEIPTQSLYVDGYRPNLVDAGFDESPGWLAWQANHMDARQTAVHRGAFTYGFAYVMVVPGDPLPVIRGYSPRELTVVYGDDVDWPLYGLRVEANGDHETLTLIDEQALYRFTTEGGLQHVQTNEYEGETGGVCPIVRFLNLEDLDGVMVSEVERLMPIQDQLDVTSFDLLVSQHYQAFLQRYIIGWEAADEGEKFKAGASRLWTFDDPDVSVGAFQQAQLDGYLKSRDSQAQLLAVISQTPPHHLLGDLINLSAEALAAAESGHRRKITMRQVGNGESWEQVLALAEVEMGITPNLTSQVRWRDTEARSLAQTVDALGKLAEMLGVPPEALWERVPGATQQDIALWRQMAEDADALGQLTGLLTSQGLGPVPPPEVTVGNGAGG